MKNDRDEKFITLRLKVCIGRLRVSPMCLFFGSLGLLQSVHVKFSRNCHNTIRVFKKLSKHNGCIFYLEGVCAAKHLMKRAMVMTKPMPIRRTPYQ